MNLLDSLMPRPRLLTKRSDWLRWKPTRSQVRAADNCGALAAGLVERVLGTNLRGGFEIKLRMEPSLGATWRGVADRVRAELYRINITRRSMMLTARTVAGLCRGIQTLKQLIEEAEHTGFIPCLEIRDWPTLPVRGLHIDLARETEYRSQHLKRVIDLAAYLRFNAVHLYLEGRFAYPSLPESLFENIMTPVDAELLRNYGAEVGIELVPHVNTLGHVEHFLSHPRFQHLREHAKSAVHLCPTHPESRPLLRGLIADLVEAFRPTHIHLGEDESSAGACPRCRKTGPPTDVLGGHVAWVCQEAAGRGVRPMIYGDRFISPTQFPAADAANGGTPGEARRALRMVPRDTIITDWHYTAPDSNTVQWFVRAGFETHITSASNSYLGNFGHPTREPRYIRETIRNGIAQGASGALHCNWEHLAGSYFDNYWYYNAIAAEAMWGTAHDPDYELGPRFSRRFYGLDRDYYNMIAHEAEMPEEIWLSRQRTAPSILSFRRTHFILDNPFNAYLHGSIGDGDGYTLENMRRTGELIEQWADEFRRAAMRNRDTLRLVHMPGLIWEFLAAKGLATLRCVEAMREGKPRRAITALRGALPVAEKVRQAFLVGDKFYGSGRAKRNWGSTERLETQVQRIRSATQRLAKQRPAQLRRLNPRKFLESC